MLDKDRQQKLYLSTESMRCRYITMSMHNIPYRIESKHVVLVLALKEFRLVVPADSFLAGHD